MGDRRLTGDRPVMSDGRSALDDRRLTVDIERRYRAGPTISAALDLDLAAGETLVLFGPSGSGKTTILRCLAGLERPDRGTIVAEGRPWVDVTKGMYLPPQARRIGYLPQGFALFPHLTVADNIAFGIDRGSREERARRVAELVTLLGLDGLEARPPGTLSGGQQQRAALGRALARDPVLLLLDEPLAALDTPTRESLRLELRRLLVRIGTPAVVVTHDRTETLVLGDRVAVLVDGRIRQIGGAAEVFARPANAEVARVTGVETVVAGIVEAAGEGLAAIRVGESTVIAVADSVVGESVVVTIRPEEVLLTASNDVGGMSARNRLAATVVDAEPLGAVVRVTLDCGFRLVALVTRLAFEELEVAPGGSVTAIVKAPSIHVIRHDRAL